MKKHILILITAFIMFGMTACMDYQIPIEEKEKSETVNAEVIAETTISSVTTVTEIDTEVIKEGMILIPDYANKSIEEYTALLDKLGIKYRTSIAYNNSPKDRIMYLSTTPGELFNTRSDDVLTIYIGKKKKTEYHSDVPSKTVGRETLIDYVYGTAFLNENHFLYKFSNHESIGIISGKDYTYKDDEIIHYEAEYGYIVDTEGFYLKITPYNHTNQSYPITNAYYESDFGYRINMNLAYNQPYILNCEGAKQGLYRISVEFDGVPTEVYFYIAENGVFTCRTTIKYESLDYNIIRYAKLLDMMESEGITIENSLSLDNFVYPGIIYGLENPNHTDLYRQLSYDILKGYGDCSDEFKIYLYSKWITENIKYDSFEADNNVRRESYYNDYTGTHSTWNNHVGVCHDVANIMTIMLREQGIPTTSAESRTHIWNVIYINGEWIEFDFTKYLYMYVKGENVNEYTTEDISYYAYGNEMSPGELLEVDKTLCTRENIQKYS